MNKWVAIPVVVVLFALSVTNGILYFQQSIELNTLKEVVSSQGDDFSILWNDFSNLESDFGGMQTSFTNLESNFAGLQTDVLNLDSDLGNLQGSVLTLEGGFINLQGDLSTLSDGFSIFEGSVNVLEGDIVILQSGFSSLESNIATLNSGVASLESDVNSLEDDVSALEVYDQAVIDVVTNLEPSIVRIVVNLGGGNYVGGSGVIISDDGWVLTNHHVLDGFHSIEVTMMNGDVYDGGDIFWYSLTWDAALFKINSTRTDFPLATLGLSNDIIVGEEVVAIGYPQGFIMPGQATVTTGIVSAIRTFDNSELFQALGVNGLEFIQTDAAVNHGNSGGPLVNLNGEVIGINTWGWWDTYLGENITNLNFAIPIDYLKPFIDGVLSQ